MSVLLALYVALSAFEDRRPCAGLGCWDLPVAGSAFCEPHRVLNAELDRRFRRVT